LASSIFTSSVLLFFFGWQGAERLSLRAASTGARQAAQAVEASTRGRLQRVEAWMRWPSDHSEDR